MESVPEAGSSRSERIIRAFMDGAESGMVEARGYGLTLSEREEAERVARDLYGNHGESEIVAA